MREQTVIIGAGIAGLTLGYQLSNAGKDCIILEKESTIGGLARSFEYDGYTFDIGPHRFHTDDKKVEEFIYKILVDNYLTIPRSSGVWMFKHYHDWPLHISSAFKLPPVILFKSALDLLSKRNKTGSDFRSYVENMYGKTLTDNFFEPYTQKFMKYPTSKFHADWAKAGINRAVIDKRVKAGTLYEVITGMIFRPNINTKFICPKDYGIQEFCNLMAKDIKSHGGEIITGCEIADIVSEGDVVRAVKTNIGDFECDKLIWSAPITTLTDFMGLSLGVLQYSAGVYYNIMLNEPENTNYQWCYYGQHDISFARTSYPRNFSQKNVPEGCGSVCAEMSAIELDAVWRRPEHFVDLIKQNLKDVKLISSCEVIKDIKIEKISNTYPMYEIDYRENLKKKLDYLKKWRNIVLLGRLGSFWYNNMDHSIRMALDIAEDIINDREIQIGKYRDDFFKKII